MFCVTKYNMCDAGHIAVYNRYPCLGGDFALG